MNKCIVSILVSMMVLISCGSDTSERNDEERYNRTVEFSGYNWYVKASDEKVGPGPNIFSDSVTDVRVDENGWLHLKIDRNGAIWHCAEIVCADSLGYGTYSFELADPVNELDRNTVLGVFTWDDDAPPYYREIDIELSRWGDADYADSQYVVQPYTVSGNMHRFETSYNGGTVHSFAWSRDGVAFKSAKTDGSLIESWNYTPDLSGTDYPVPGNEKLHINFWLLENSAPSDGVEKEVVIKKFSFDGYKGRNG
ncbi:MAG TPA: hypothetical protein PKK43_07005 [Spirochaetota bacterium]|nr:hypothetical protein [Spirochaetota bacterium]